MSEISFPGKIGPLVFTVRARNGVQSTVVRLAVAGSVLRRCIFGVKFTLQECLSNDIEIFEMHNNSIRGWIADARIAITNGN